MASLNPLAVVGAGRVRPYAGSLAVRDYEVVNELAKGPDFGETVRSAPLGEWAVHILRKPDESRTDANELPFGQTVSEFASTLGISGDVIIALRRVPNAAAPAPAPGESPQLFPA
jgi:hypothetical protein